MTVRARPIDQRGLSLIELMVAVAVAIILALMALPVYQTWVASQQARTAAESLLDGLRIAQGEAVKRNQRVSFVLTVATGWEAQLFEDKSVLRDGRFAEGTPQVTVAVDPADGSTVVFDGLGRVLDKDGLVPLADRVTIDIVSSTVAGARPQRVIIDTAAATGTGIRSCDPKLGAGDPRACPA